MRRTSRIYKNNIGSRIVLRCKDRTGAAYDDVSTANEKKIVLTAPSGSEQVFDLAFATSPFGNGTGTDGVLEYITTSTSDLPESGRYEVQGYIEFSATDKRYIQPAIIYVGEIPTASVT